MTDEEVTQLLNQLKEARANEQAARQVVESLESVLRRNGISWGDNFWGIMWTRALPDRPDQKTFTAALEELAQAMLSHEYGKDMRNEERVRMIAQGDWTAFAGFVAERAALNT